MLKGSFAPLWSSHFAEAEANAKYSTDPGKESGSLEKVEPRSHNLVVAIIYIVVMMVISARNIVPNPVNIKEYLLSWIYDKTKCLEQTYKKKPVENIFFSIHLDDSWFFEDLVEHSICRNNYHH